MSWNAFKDIANKNIKNKGIDHKIKSSLIIESANFLLADFLSGQALDKIQAVYFRSGILTLAVLDDDLLNDFDKSSFVKKLNDKLESHLVFDINFLK